MNSYLQSCERQFRYYKSLAQGAFLQLEEEAFFKKDSVSNNSIAVIMQHLAGNMLSRWTEPFESDGEKPWRHRDDEFKDNFKTKVGILEYWEEGWYVLLDFVENLQEDDLEKTVYIRNMGHSVVEALNRQLCHYAYHVGQIVLLAKQHKGQDWVSLSIPLGKSEEYNTDKMEKGPRKAHFTEDL